MSGVPITDLIVSADDAVRNTDVADWIAGKTYAEALEVCRELERIRNRCDNLYQRVRALFLLHAIHRYHLPEYPELAADGHIPWPAVSNLLKRRFEESIDHCLRAAEAEGMTDPLASALATVYQRLAFQRLADQVRRSVRSVRGNQ